MNAVDLIILYILKITVTSTRMDIRRCLNMITITPTIANYVSRNFGLTDLKLSEHVPNKKMYQCTYYITYY